MYTGKLPFFGEFEADLFRKIQSGKSAPLPADMNAGQLIKSLFNSIFQVD